MRDRRGLRGKSRHDADDRAVERAKAEAAKERADREAAIEIVNADLDEQAGDIDTLDDFRTRPAGFAGSSHSHGTGDLPNFAAAGHQHGADDINAVHWSKVGTGQSPVPKFAKASDLAALRRWAQHKFKPL